MRKRNPVEVKREKKPARGKRALKKVGRAVKGAARSLLGAGSQILGAGAQALNPGMPRSSRDPILKDLLFDYWSTADMRASTLDGMRSIRNRLARLRAEGGGRDRIARDTQAAKDMHKHIKGLDSSMAALKKQIRKRQAQLKRNPRGQHLPGLPAKAQREYEHVLKSEKAMGRSTKRAKSIAAGKVRKDYARNTSYVYWNVYHIDTKKSAPYDKTFLGSSHFGATRAEAIEKFKRSHYPGRIRPGTKLVAEKAVITKNKAAKKRRRNASDKVITKRVTTYRKRPIGQYLFSGGMEYFFDGYMGRMAGYSTLAETKAAIDKEAQWYEDYYKSRGVKIKPPRNAPPRRRRNLGHKDSDHPVEVTHHYRAGPPGYLTPWQRAHHAGQKQLFETGIKPAKKRNASKKRKTANPMRKGMRKGYREAKRISKITRGRFFSSESGQRKAARHEKRQTRKGRRNPSAVEIRKKFAGRAGAGRDLYFPNGTPSGSLAKLGKLVLIKAQAGDITPAHGTAWLCADTKGKLHIGSTKPAPLFAGPAGNLGPIRMIEYEETKPHLGYPNPTIWFHRLGEETGHRPTLHADKHGGLHIKGGAYRITRRGIEN